MPSLAFAADPSVELNLAACLLLILVFGHLALLLGYAMLQLARKLAARLDHFAEHWKLWRACCRHIRSR